MYVLFMRSQNAVRRLLSCIVRANWRFFMYAFGQLSCKVWPLCGVTLINSRCSFNHCDTCIIKCNSFTRGTFPMMIFFYFATSYELGLTLHDSAPKAEHVVSGKWSQSIQLGYTLSSHLYSNSKRVPRQDVSSPL